MGLSWEQAREAVIRTIDSKAQEVLSLARSIYKQPELGYREFNTARLVSIALSDMGLEVTEGLAVTGVKAVASGCQDSPRIAIFGEMDAVICHSHPDADPSTGAVHACGHNAQVAAMVGAAVGLTCSGVLSSLQGSIAFVAVPAEEYVEMEARAILRDRGIVSFFGGKQEMLYRGHLADVDMAVMFHLDSDLPERRVRMCTGSNGFVGKMVRYIGQEAHAGASPHRGVNALNAAMLGLMGVHVQRETFRDADNIRVHPIITKGGDLVNIVPSDVRLETYVRGSNMEAVKDASSKVDRALRAGAHSVGAEVRIENVPGYLPLRPDPRLNVLFAENARRLLGPDSVVEGPVMMGSTDMGDITQVMPGIHPMLGGTRGQAHTRDFRVVDEEMAYVVPSKALALTVVDLLHRDAGEVWSVLQEYRPAITKEEYYEKWRGLIEE